MCLHIKSKDFNLKTTKKDIVVYKEVRLIQSLKNKRYLKNTVCSYYIHLYKYVKKKIQPVINIELKDDMINEGYHFYRKISKTQIYFYINNKAFNTTMAEFIIPKGTKYCIKKYSNLGVAESIIFNRIVSNNEILNYRDKL